MTTKNIANSIKNAMGTIFLLAGAFFVCSTVLSIRAVFADPIAPVMDITNAAPQSPRATNSVSRAAGRTSPRNSVSNRTVARTATNVAPSRATSSRANIAPSRATSTRGVTTRSANSNSRATTRNVVSRTTTANRAVRARTATNASAVAPRVSLQGSAIRGSKGNTTSSISYLSGKLYTGNYSNIIDNSTGLISNDAFNNCMESYYTCMDEICTARNAAQRRCACAGRVKSFDTAERALESANEELIKLSGELALLIASGGKDISAAFQLTDAEKVLNCVSWKDASRNGKWDGDITAKDWCESHGIYGDEKCNLPSYCKEEGNSFGFNINNIDGTNSSEILASVRAFADAVAETKTIGKEDNDAVADALTNLNGALNSMTGITIENVFASDTKVADTLAETWGYDLFAYAHNEVCSRVLDSCFNGIYEACGSPSSFGGRCADGQTNSCPFNYNSKIKVSSAGEIELFERGKTVSTNSSASCFGYSSASGDPYSNLRGTVADARRSIMNKYLLDANADCDLYGEQIRTTAQNISYQKFAAQQALQQKRQEFAQTEESDMISDAIAAYTNFNECIGEILGCYEDISDSNPNWPEARIKTYCHQIANVPHCYEEMICNPSTAQFKAVIDMADNEQCLNDQDYTKNTCRNIVTLNEILRGTGATAAGNIPAGAKGSSMAMREQCLLDAGVEEIRTWSPETVNYIRCTLAELRAIDANAKTGIKESNNSTCVIETCNPGYSLQNNRCVTNNIDCKSEIPNAVKATRTISNNTVGECVLQECADGYTISNNRCVVKTQDCLPQLLNALNATSGTQTWENGTFGDCVISECKSGYTLDSENNSCVAN